MTISEIKKEYNNLDKGGFSAFIAAYEHDERAGVQRLIERAKHEIILLSEEKKRIEELRFFERKYEEYACIAGVDEVGRGPLAGPVVAAAVVLPRDVDIYYINDSKKLSAKRREMLYDEITSKAVTWACGVIDEKVIDEINILEATYKAMRQAIGALDPAPDLLLNDAVVIPGIDIRQVGIKQGDAKSISIGAASIVAKVTRDRMMVEFDEVYPGYGFAKHKGYGTREHYEAIERLGLCDIHRRSFLKNVISSQ